MPPLTRGFRRETRQVIASSNASSPLSYRHKTTPRPTYTSLKRLRIPPLWWLWKVSSFLQGDSWRNHSPAEDAFNTTEPHSHYIRIQHHPPTSAELNRATVTDGAQLSSMRCPCIGAQYTAEVVNFGGDFRHYTHSNVIERVFVGRLRRTDLIAQRPPLETDRRGTQKCGNQLQNSQQYNQLHTTASGTAQSTAHQSVRTHPLFPLPLSLVHPVLPNLNERCSASIAPF